MNTTFCNGYAVFEYDTNDNVVRETLFAVIRGNGDIYRSETHKKSSLFDSFMRTWTKVDSCPVDAEYIGKYLINLNRSV